MYARVTAVLVARNGAPYLERTLEALRAQTRQPDAVVLVDSASRDATADMFAKFAPTQLVQTNDQLTFGQAIGRAVRVMQPPAGEDEWLWLLAQDSAPEPGALAALLGAVEVAPSVAVAGPKQMDWTRRDHMRSYGESVTRYGTTVHLIEDELDQGQHDANPDVLAVAAGGMLVRHALWEELGGFDPGLPIVDDALDFCIRTRLAGHRVSRVPEARVATARIGLERIDGRRISSGERRRARQHRVAQLHRRLSYAHTALVLVHWLSLVPLAIGRSVVRLLRKQPGYVGGELLAGLIVAFGGTKVSRARKVLRTSKNVGWKSIAGLRIPLETVRQMRSVRHDAVRVTAARERHPLRFFGGGGVWVVLVAALAGLVLYAPLVAASAVSGGGLLPLSTDVAELWRNAAYGWRDIGVGFVGAADPFGAVLAVLGSLTFWAPSYILVLLYLVALPVAAMGAWFMIARITPNTGARTFGALLWALAPAFFAAQAEGRPAAILVHVLLPWLFFAGFGAYRSWSASATASLLAAAIAACAPVLAIPLLLIWIVVLAMAGRRIGRFIGMPIPAAVLLFPLVLARFQDGDPLAALADPGVQLASQPVDIVALFAGVPTALPTWWLDVLGGLGIASSAAGFATLVCLLPLLLAALFALVVPDNLRALGGIGIAALGLITAVAAGGLQLTTSGAETVSVWAGTGLSLYWLGLVVCVSITLSSLPKLRLTAGAVVTATAILAVVPLAVAFPMGTAAVMSSSDRAVPAYVAAEAANSPRVGTIVLTPQVDGGILVNLVRGAGDTLDEQSTLVASGARSNTELDVLAGNLASRTGMDLKAELDALGVRFVVLAPTTEADGVAGEVRARAAVALDGNALFSSAGDSPYGLLWRVTDDSAVAVVEPPTGVVGPFGGLYLAGLLVVFLVTLLLAVPTGLSLERTRSGAAVAGIDDEPAEATGQFDDGGDDV
ncbi:glycosyltransferase family 2 protein [Microbacteriaceae bacterium VKM Ac-2854]|nr:glycosyltransferase family 2 protein [Microbacteriaceae bacterium VKM Ac-2854]